MIFWRALLRYFGLGAVGNFSKHPSEFLWRPRAPIQLRNLDFLFVFRFCFQIKLCTCFISLAGIGRQRRDNRAVDDWRLRISEVGGRGVPKIPRHIKVVALQLIIIRGVFHLELDVNVLCEFFAGL